MRGYLDTETRLKITITRLKQTVLRYRLTIEKQATKWTRTVFGSLLSLGTFHRDHAQAEP
ncbi:MAG: hypothetical protein A2749_01220 [Parcubacteria group bacterium RIFCSPHIGHO2_01_FULL_45_26]|nr:MAG: hypothetical protein A2749_01220 [Parcubacteria group bacterium RIFCSPHIGHO2_01_FULL_45_26]